MKLQVVEIIAPAYWASYLTNGDASGIGDEEAKRCDAFMAKHYPYVDVVDVKGEPFFSWSYDAYGGDSEGGDLCEYVGLLEVAA